MKKYLILSLLTALLLSSCCPCRHLATSSRDSVRVEIRTRTEYVRDTSWIKIPAESERQTVLIDTSYLETSFAVSEAHINFDGSLYHSLANKPQDKPVPFERPIEYRDSIVYRDKSVDKIIQVPRELTWWQQTQIRGFWFLAAAFAVWIAWRRVRR